MLDYQMVNESHFHNGFSSQGAFASAPDDEIITRLKVKTEINEHRILRSLIMKEYCDMRKVALIAALVMFPLVTIAAETPYLFDFVQGKETGKAYSKLIDREHLPDWVKRGGTSTPASEVTINGQKYLALSGCKPHNCPSESIAVLYSPEKGDIHGVYSEYDAASDKQTLKWLNLNPINSVEMRSVLFNTLGGN